MDNEKMFNRKCLRYLKKKCFAHKIFVFDEPSNFIIFNVITGILAH